MEEIYRTFLYFNTPIPSNATITNAILSLYVSSKDIDEGNFDIVVQNGQPIYPHLTLSLADFNCDYYKNNGGSINTADITESQYNTITLNSNGKAWINKGGTTKLCLRSSRDIAGTVPTGAEQVIIYASEKGGDYRPKLTITYTI